MPAALQATGPRKPRSIGNGEKSPSNSRPCAAAGSTEDPDDDAGTSVLLTSASGSAHQPRPAARPPARSCAGVIPPSALLSARYDAACGPVNDTPIARRADLSPSS